VLNPNARETESAVSAELLIPYDTLTCHNQTR